MLPRLIATDLDGTLLRADGTIDPRTRRALSALRERGTATVLCTARPARWITELAASGGIAGPAVCANGAVLWDLEAGALIDSFPVACDAALEVVERLRRVVPGGAWAVEGIDSFAHEPGYRTRWPVPDDTVVADIETLLEQPPIKLLLRRPQDGFEALVAEARAAVDGLAEVTWSDATAALLEISAAGVSKGSGLAGVCAARGIRAAEVIAFGDMPNDAAMLTWAGHGVAMGNAHPELAARADEVTLTNEQHGVAAVLERLLAEAGG
jgi:Cof subfamily protein (haloacid dehalogenase superfamily)